MGAAKTVPHVSCTRLVVLEGVTWCGHGVLVGVIFGCVEGWAWGGVHARRLKAESRGCSGGLTNSLGEVRPLPYLS